MAGRIDTTDRPGSHSPDIVLDDLDRRIIALLTVDGRLSMNELAARAKVSRATAYNRFERLRTHGVLTGFRAVVDPAAIGYPIAALILVNLVQGQWQPAREQLLQLPGLEYLAFTSGSFDAVVLVRLPDVAALRELVLDRLHGLHLVHSTQTIFMLDEVRRHVVPEVEVDAGPRRY